MVHTKVELTVSVHHWKEEDGKPVFMGKSTVYLDGYRPSFPKGWYCWAYPSDDRLFEGWMDRICPTAEYQHRFNSGDPMYTVQIFSEKESMLFQLAWVK